LASPVSDALFPTFDMKKVPWHTYQRSLFRWRLTRVYATGMRPGDARAIHHVRRKDGAGASFQASQMAAPHARIGVAASFGAAHLALRHAMADTNATGGLPPAPRGRD
jgi:hypothetical protein